MAAQPDWLVKLRTEYVRTFPEKLARLESLIAAIRKEPALLEPRDEILRFLHSLEGSAGSYGFSDLRTIAGESHETLETIFRVQGPLEATAIGTMCGILRHLGTCIRVHAEALPQE